MAAITSAKEFFHTASERLGVLDTTAVTFTKTRATQAAASLAYYTFFSIFPLMLLLVLVGSFFLDRQVMVQGVTQAIQSALPVSQQFITNNLMQVLQQRTAVGIFVLISLLWSASNMFNNLAFEINQAWPEARRRNFLQSRLIGLDMILGLTGLLILTIILDAVAKWLAGPSTPNAPLSSLNIWTIVSSVVSWIAVFLLYLAMYRWVPTVPVAWSASAWGALAASIGWKAATTGFSWYLNSPFARYELVYGSLGTIVAFLFLIYIIALVTLFGAHLASAIDHLNRRTQDTVPPDAITRARIAAAKRESKEPLTKHEGEALDTSGPHVIPVTSEKEEEAVEAEEGDDEDVEDEEEVEEKEAAAEQAEEDAEELADEADKDSKA
ncbi:MAG: YihY/virulence factor BrkB family protein [Anaerolineae bacterium]